jgi:hypothetical protein
MKILKDVFPAHLAVVAPNVLEDVYDLKSSPATKDAYYLATTRVIVTDEVVVVAQDSPNGARIVFQEKYETFLPVNSAEDSRVITVSGKMLAFKKDTNCGCGSRLRSWNPYKTITSMKDPI